MSQENNRTEERRMDERRVMKLVVAGLVIIGLLWAGTAMRNEAWTQGYTMGLLASGAGGSDITPYLLHRVGPGFGQGAGFFGGVARLAFLFLLVAGVFKLLGFGYWRRHGGPPPWAHQSRGCWQWDDGSVQGDAAPAGAGAQEAAVQSAETPQPPAVASGQA